METGTRMIKHVIGVAVALLLMAVVAPPDTAAAQQPQDKTAYATLCVTVQGFRSAGTVEEVSGVLIDPTSTVFDFDTAAITPFDGADYACFAAKGIPKRDFVLRVDSADTLQANGWITFPNPGGLVHTGLTLIEGDANGDNLAINYSDFAIFAKAWGSTDDRADFNEDGRVNFIDFALFVNNWGTTAGQR